MHALTAVTHRPDIVLVRGRRYLAFVQGWSGNPLGCDAHGLLLNLMSRAFQCASHAFLHGKDERRGRAGFKTA